MPADFTTTYQFFLPCNLSTEPIPCLSLPSGTDSDQGGGSEQRTGGPIPHAGSAVLQSGRWGHKLGGFLQPSTTRTSLPSVPPARPVTLQRPDTVRPRFQHIQRGVKTHNKTEQNTTVFLVTTISKAPRIFAPERSPRRSNSAAANTPNPAVCGGHGPPCSSALSSADRGLCCPAPRAH